MTSRERVRKALTFGHPDRVPRDIWVLPAAVNSNGKEPLELIHRTYPMDLCHEWNYLSGDSYTPGTHLDEWGVTWTTIRAGYTGEVKEALIKDWDDLKRLKAPLECIRTTVEKAEHQARDTECFTCAFAGTLFERAQFLRGVENLYMDIHERGSGFSRLLGIIHDYNKEMVRQLCKTKLDAVFMADDWGSQKSLLIDPEAWASIFKPYYREYARLAHEAGKFFFLHSDGYIMDIYEHLIEIDVDAVNSQLFCMDLEELGRRFRGRITFWGEISRQHALNKADARITRDAVRTVRRNLWDEKGGVIAQCSYEGDGKPENVMAMYEEWLR
jgi:uroporphyrinogen decarboxylase